MKIPKYMYYKHLLLVLFISLFRSTLLLANEESGSKSDSISTKSKNSEEKKDELYLLNQLINKYIKSDLNKATQFGVELLNMSLDSGNDKEIQNAYLKLSKIENKKGNYESSINFCLKSLEFSSKIDDKRSQSHTLNNLGLLYQKIGKYELSLQFLNNSLEIKETLKDSLGMSASYNNIGMFYSDINDYDQSLNYYFKSLEIKKKIDTLGIISTSYTNIGTLYHRLGEYHKALEYYNKALETCELFDNLLQIPNLLLNTGLLYKDLGNKDMALEYYQKSLKLSLKHGLKGEYAKGILLEGSLYYEMMDYEKANSYYFKSLDLFNQIDDLYNLANTYQNIGKTQYKLKAFKKSEKYLKISNDISIKHNFKSKISNNYYYLSLVYQERFMFDQALVHYKNHIIYKDSIYNEESDKRLIKIQIEHEVLEKKRELEKLEKNEKVKDLEILKRTNYIIILMIILLFMVSLIFLIIQKNKFAKKTSIILNEQQKTIYNQEKNDLKLDLEVKNKELTTNVMNLIEKNALIQNTANSLGDLKSDFGSNEEKEIAKIIKNLKSNANKGLRNEFEKHFSEVYNEFYENLMLKFPSLTPNERKLCAFPRLDMSTKDIATITLRSPHSINVARTRLRKKIGLANTDININTYLTQF